MQNGWLRLSPLFLVTLGLFGVAHAQSPPVAATSITLEDAIRMAQKNEPAFAAAKAESAAAALERKDARAALLPTAILHNQYLFTESNHSSATTTQGGVSQSLPVFIANNAVHEY